MRSSGAVRTIFRLTGTPGRPPAAGLPADGGTASNPFFHKNFERFCFDEFLKAWYTVCNRILLEGGAFTLIEYYLQYFSELCEGRRLPPGGIMLTAEDANARAAELLPQIEAMGVASFVRLCAEADGTQIPQEVFDSFDPEALAGILAQADAQTVPEAPAGPVESEIRDIYEVFLDSVCLDDALVQYLIDIIKRGAREEFRTLSHAAARTLLDMDDFLAWLGNKELLADEDERACAAIMDGCFERLRHEGQLELLAALLSGDETTFKLLRTQAPELLHLPDATYDWYCKNYLDKYYPVRFLMRFHGIAFPQAT